MRILQLNKYFHRRGGAEVMMFAIDRALRERGHDTIHFSMADPRNEPSPWARYFAPAVTMRPPSAGGLVRMFGSRAVRRCIERLVSDAQPDVALLHNTYHQLGPSVVLALDRLGVPMVQLLHDHKIVCPAYSLFRDGRTCDTCAHGAFYSAAIHGCGGSRAAGAALALEAYWRTRVVRTDERIRAFVAPSQFLADSARAMGFSRPIQVIRNFTEHSETVANPAHGEAIGYAGRLTLDKGVDVLIRAAREVPEVLVRVAGDGPEAGRLRRDAPPNVHFLGRLQPAELQSEMARWRAAVVPSLWHENAPLAALEAMELGLPVIASRTGGIPELVDDTGTLVAPGDVPALATALTELWNDGARCHDLGASARARVRAMCDRDTSIAALERVCADVIARRDATAPPGSSSAKS